MGNGLSSPLFQSKVEGGSYSRSKNKAFSFLNNVSYCDGGEGDNKSAPPISIPPTPTTNVPSDDNSAPTVDNKKKGSFLSSLLHYPNLPNPGSFDNINGSVRRVIMVDAFDGLRFELSKQMSPLFQINHFFMLGSSQIPKEQGCGMYNFSATLPHGSQFYTPNGIVNSSIDTGARVQTRLISQLTKNISTRVTLGLSPSIEETQLNIEADYKGRDFGVTAKYIFGQNITELNYLQSITPKLAIGTHL